MTGIEPAQQAATCGLDATGWVNRWELQQAGYVPEREQTFNLMLDVLHRLEAAPGRLLDLGCGPGTLADRVVTRWPSAQVTGVDLDPVLLELGRRTLGNKVRWLEADLRQPSWTTGLEGPPFDAALSATALHWLDADRLGQLVHELANLLRSGGVFANYDTMPLDSSTPRLGGLGNDLRDAISESAITAHGTESWSQWWQAIRAESALADQFVERARRFGTSDRAPKPSITRFIRILKDAGFREAAPIKQIADRHLLVAIR